MLSTKRLSIGLAACYWAGVFLILAITYPILDDYRYGLLTAGGTAVVYSEMTSCIWLLGLAIWFLVTQVIKRRSYVRAVTAFLSIAFALGGYGIFMLRVVQTELSERLLFEKMHAHFFRDYMAVQFTWVTGPLCALLLAGLILTDAKLHETRTIS